MEVPVESFTSELSTTFELDHQRLTALVPDLVVDQLETLTEPTLQAAGPPCIFCGVNLFQLDM
jgi:hypothetical protein